MNDALIVSMNRLHSIKLAEKQEDERRENLSIHLEHQGAKKDSKKMILLQKVFRLQFHF